MPFKTLSFLFFQFPKDEVDLASTGLAPPGVDFVQHRFQSRTLNIFLKEMRSALKSENIPEAYKILDDLEYVAKNLESPKRSRQVWATVSK